MPFWPFAVYKDCFEVYKKAINKNKYKREHLLTWTFTMKRLKLYTLLLITENTSKQSKPVICSRWILKCSNAQKIVREPQPMGWDKGNCRTMCSSGSVKKLKFSRPGKSGKHKLRHLHAKIIHFPPCIALGWKLTNGKVYFEKVGT